MVDLFCEELFVVLFVDVLEWDGLFVGLLLFISINVECGLMFNLDNVWFIFVKNMDILVRIICYLCEIEEM